MSSKEVPHKWGTQGEHGRAEKWFRVAQENEVRMLGVKQYEMENTAQVLSQGTQLLQEKTIIKD
jgi:hypothetical protein